MAHPLPIHSWKLIGPWDVSAVKLGASSLMRSMVFLLFLTTRRRVLPSARGAGTVRPALRVTFVPSVLLPLQGMSLTIPAGRVRFLSVRHVLIPRGCQSGRQRV